MVPARHPGERGAGAQDDQIALVPRAGVVAHGVRRDLDDLSPGQPLVRTGALRGGGQVAAQGGQHLTRLDDRVGPAQQAARQLTAQRRVDGPDAGRIEQLQFPPVRVRQASRLLEQGELRVLGGQGERARGPEARGRAPGRPVPPTARGHAAPGSSSAPALRPLTQTRPKFLTLAPRASASRSNCTTSKPRRRAITACIVPSTPPPTTTIRCVSHTIYYSQSANMYSQLSSEATCQRMVLVTWSSLPAGGSCGFPRSGCGITARAPSALTRAPAEAARHHRHTRGPSWLPRRPGRGESVR